MQRIHYATITVQCQDLKLSSIQPNETSEGKLRTECKFMRRDLSQMFTIAPISKHFVEYLTALNSHRLRLCFTQRLILQCIENYSLTGDEYSASRWGGSTSFSFMPKLAVKKFSKPFQNQFHVQSSKNFNQWWIDDSHEVLQNIVFFPINRNTAWEKKKKKDF